MQIDSELSVVMRTSISILLLALLTGPFQTRNCPADYRHPLSLFGKLFRLFVKFPTEDNYNANDPRAILEFGPTNFQAF